MSICFVQTGSVRCRDYRSDFLPAIWPESWSCSGECAVHATYWREIPTCIYWHVANPEHALPGLIAPHSVRYFSCRASRSVRSGVRYSVPVPSSGFPADPVILPVLGIALPALRWHFATLPVAVTGLHSAAGFPRGCPAVVADSTP